MSGSERVARLAARLVERIADLPPAETRDVGVETVSVPMPDGAKLAATHYVPRDLDDRPTVLIRSPYPRALFGLVGRLHAERGFHALVQNCRGTFGSEGEFVPFENERADGLATIEWLERQEWFTGELGTTGMSYLGYTQWAVADHPAVDAVSTRATASDFERVTRPGGAFALGLALRWAASMADPQSARRFFARSAGVGVDVESGFETLPLVEADRTAVGEPIDAWRRNFGDADRWRAIDRSDRVADAAPNHLVGGWHDIALPALLDDYRRLVDAGRDPYLTIGPWAHEDPGLARTGVEESIRWLRAHLLDDEAALRDAPVRIYVQSADEWRHAAEWPPDAATERRHLRAGDALARDPPPNGDADTADFGPDEFRYDPRTPTPTVGGATFGGDAGRVDQSALEARSDVRTYTGAPLERPLEVIGPVTAQLYVGSNRESVDVYACLCDVDPSGASLNVTDGIRRVAFDEEDGESGGPHRVAVDLWPTAYRFGAGHRLRLQVAGGSFPRWDRNPGTADHLGESRSLLPDDRRIFRDPERPSAVSLPVVR